MRIHHSIENQNRREAARGRLERTLMSLRNADTLLDQQVASNSRELPQPISQDYGRLRSAQIFHTPIAVRQPLPQEVFRYHPNPEYTVTLPLLYWREHNEYYFIDSDVHDDRLSVDMQPIRLHTCINRRKQVFLLPLRVSDRRGRQDPYLIAMNQALAQAWEDWIRLVRQPGTSIFKVRSMGFEDPPEWPQMDMEEIVNLAFLNEHYIDSLEHPAVEALLGRRMQS